MVTTQSNFLDTLIKAAYSGPIFGKDVSFGPNASDRMPIVKEQIEIISHLFNKALYQAVQTSMPELSDPAVHRIMLEIGPKAVCFCPALTIGELTGKENTERLAAAAIAIGIMYFADQTMDRGDELTVSAIALLCGERSVVSEDEPSVQRRLQTLHGIQINIDALALPEDAPIVLNCFNGQVLHNEVRLHRLSNEYVALANKERLDFLDTHADHIAELMVIDAGFPSVTSSLYAIYRKNDPSLPSLSAIHADTAIVQLLQICNAVVRIADEVGDWESDTGEHPEWGIFSINPFNQYHPRLVARLCELAGIDDSGVVEHVQHAFETFHTDEQSQERYGRYIVDTFFDHVRTYIDTLPTKLQDDYRQYITLCKRVLEIGSVNTIGDIALADVDSASS
jgi:hypothetical protein